MASPSNTRRPTTGNGNGNNNIDGVTVVGGPGPLSHVDNADLKDRNSSEDEKSFGISAEKRAAKMKDLSATAASAKFMAKQFGVGMDYFLEDRPFCVKIDKSGLIVALQKLEKQLNQIDGKSILSKKRPTDWLGRQVAPGQLGLVNHGGLPKVLTKPGRYPGFPFGNWWARDWSGTKGLSDTVIEYLGLTVVQVSQNQAAVVSDPQNQIFVIKDGGFVAYAAEGTYDVLEIIDQTHLKNKIVDPITNVTLGWTRDVYMNSNVGGVKQQYAVALFLNIPANNCAILQKGDDLELLPAGQHCITNPNVTLRSMFTLGENQIEMPTKDIFTRDQVPVSLTIYLKWQLLEPMKLTTHGYNTPYEALRDKTQSILTQIVAHLDYSSMVKQRSLGPDNLEDAADPSSAFLDALRTRAMDDLHEVCLDYGIVLKDFAVIDRQFKGEIARTMDKLTTRALQAQVEAANVDRENSNKVKQEEGTLSVARIKATARNTEADSQAYSVVAAAKAAAERTKIEALAAAEQTEIAARAAAKATRIQAEAEAEATRLKTEAEAQVQSLFAQEMHLRRMEVQKVRAYGAKTVFVPSEQTGAMMSSALATGMAAQMGAKAA